MKNQALTRHPGGRPSTYNERTATLICDALADGAGLVNICAREDMPDKVTVYRWLDKFPEFRIRYARARELRAESLVDEIISISDDSSGDVGPDGKPNSDNVQRARLRVDSRKWFASKVIPKLYGDRLIQDVHATVTVLDSLSPDARGALETACRELIEARAIDVTTRTVTDGDK